MSTYTQILYQIVFVTKNNEKTMIKSGQEVLYKYIWGILKNKKCHLCRINGMEMEDHLHIVTHIHPTIALAYLIKDNLIEYVKNQKEHHRKINFRDEYIDLLKEHGIEFHEKYLL